jgi:hypothetical protein
MARRRRQRQQRLSRESNGIRPGHEETSGNVSEASDSPLKTTQPGPRPPSRIAMWRSASVQMTRCCQETGFKSALPASLNSPKNCSPIGKTRHLIIRSRLPLFRRPVRLSPQVSPVFKINKALSICGLLQKGS